MNVSDHAGRWVWLCAGVLAMSPTVAAEPPPASQAADSAFAFSFSGALRFDVAASASDDENPFNQRGNLFNGVAVPRNTGFGASGTATRTGQPADNAFNLVLLRTDLKAGLKLSESFNVVARLHGAFDPAVYDEFDPAAVDSLAVGKLYGAPNYFDYDAEGVSNPNPLEWSGEDYLVYLPELFLQYNRGAFDVRIGKQTIAWGQAIFFRVLDVPDGLDLRRHSALDYAPEEFQDKRISAPAVRPSYQFSEGWLADAYVQKFQPTVYSNPNTPYNAIASQFTIHDRYAEYDSKVDYGLRVKGELGPFGVQAIGARRYNPDGVYRWTESGVDRDFAAFPGSGPLVAGTPFEVDPTGVWSADEWFTYAALARLDGVAGLNSAIAEFPASQMLGAFTVDDRQAAANELDLFFQLSGSGLRGHLAREYVAETTLGFGVSYVTAGAPGSWLDQLIVNVEALYVPDRAFTNPSLSREYLREDEWTTALVLEKYQRFSSSLPATYLVFQWLHRTQGDLFGRHLSGMGGDVDKTPPGESGGYNALVLAAQQPFANLIWRGDLSVLYEPEGGLLVQPAVRWKVSGAVSIEAFYNYVNGELGGNPNRNALSTFDYADELVLRLGYQF